MQWKATQEGADHAAPICSPTVNKCGHLRPLQQMRTQRQKDKSETKRTLQALKSHSGAGLACESSTTLLFPSFDSKRVSGKYTTKSGKVTKLVLNEEKHAKAKHALVWEPCQKTRIYPLTEIYKSHLKMAAFSVLKTLPPSKWS